MSQLVFEDGFDSLGVGGWVGSIRLRRFGMVAIIHQGTKEDSEAQIQNTVLL